MKTTISIIIEEKNLENLENRAERENRSRSNMLNRILENVFKIDLSDDKNKKS